ncbi:MAG: PQQ-binding-like beta-propeller repeat protein [Cyclobacteriaceae bacterium]
MKKIYQHMTMLLLMLSIVSVSTAQDALWQLDFEKEVVWTKITESGILLIGTSDRTIHGVDSRDGNILWSNDILRASNPLRGADGKKLEDSQAFDQFVNVLEDPDYPELGDFIEVKFSDFVASANYAVINIQTGEEVMSPEKANMPVTKFLGKERATFNFNGTTYIPELRMVLISASWIDYMVKGQPEYNLTKMVSLPDAKVIWETDEIAVDGYPYVTENGDIIMPGKKKIARMNAKTGAIKWSFEVEDKKQTFESFDLSLDLATGYFFEKKNNKGALVAHDMATGARLWEAEMKLKDVPQMNAMGYGVVTVDSKNFTLYDAANGSIKWEKKKLDGYTVDLGDMGILVTAKEKFLALLNKETGEEIWEEKISGISIDQVIGRGIMYSDAKGRLGLISYEGEKVWDKKGMLEVPNLRYRPTFTTELLYIEGDLYEVDLEEGDYRLMIEKMEKNVFEGEDGPSAIEYVDGGYLFSNSNELIMLDPDGSVRWQKFWAPPGMSLAAKIALKTAQVAMYAMAASASAQSAQHKSPYGGDTYYSKMYAEQAAAWAVAGAMVGSEARKKFTATVSKGDDMLLLTKVGEGGQKNSSGLLKVDKRTGEELGTLLLGDKKPTYDYDALTSTVFFKADNKQIICYQI